MKISDYLCVLGSFRLRDTEIINEALDIAKTFNKRVLIDTGVSYNVDHIIGKRFKSELLDVMSKFGVDHISNFDWYLTKHLEFLKVDKLEYSLVHFYEPEWQKLVRLMLDDSRIVNVGVSNFNIEQLQEYYDEFGEWPKVNEIEFSIMYHDLDLVKFCHEHDIEVLAYGVLGGIHACKQAIREYLVEGLFKYVLENGVTPVIRTDFSNHFFYDFDTIKKFKSDKLKFKNIEINSGNYSYELTENTQDPRALNKFRYDNPKHALMNYLPDAIYFSLDPYISSERCDVIPQKLSLESLKDLLLTYEEVPRKYMMITDYLVEERYKLDPESIVNVSDDVLLVYNEKLVSYVMLDDENHMIKSGACHARVFRREIKL